MLEDEVNSSNKLWSSFKYRGLLAPCHNYDMFILKTDADDDYADELFLQNG